jgi:hypothetical protein
LVDSRGLPLYFYRPDTATESLVSGQVTGQGVQDFFVATPGVAPVAGTAAPTGTAPATPSGGGYGY